MAALRALILPDALPITKPGAGACRLMLHWACARMLAGIIGLKRKRCYAATSLSATWPATIRPHHRPRQRRWCAMIYSVTKPGIGGVIATPAGRRVVAVRGLNCCSS